MKRKVSFAALACAAMLLVVCSCALGLTLPADEAPANQPIARVEKISFVIPQEGEYPSQVLVVDKMHYDGKNLMIGYRMEGDANITEEPFEDTDAAAREKEGRLFGNEHVRTIWEEFPSVRKDRRKMESCVLNRYEWVVDNRLAEGCEKSYVVEGDDGLTYLCFENLGEALRDQEAIHIQLPLLKAHCRAVWYSYDENRYYGVTGSSGDTQAIALSVPRSTEETVFPASGNVRESAVDMVAEDDNHFLIRAQDGYPEYVVEVKEGIWNGSQMQITLKMTRNERITDAWPENEAAIPWTYVGMLDEVRREREKYLPYGEKFWPYLDEMEPGSLLTSRMLLENFDLEDDIGAHILSDNRWMIKNVESDGIGRTLYYMPSGFSDEAPAWYGKDEYSLYIPLEKIVDVLYVDQNGKVYRFGTNRPAVASVPVTVIPWQTEGRLWSEVVYTTYGDVDMTSKGQFLIDGSVALEIVSAEYDGSRIEIGYRLQSNDKYRVTQELETVHWELTGPWTDLKVSYEDDVTYHRYQIRDTMDAGDERVARTAKELNWLDKDQIALSLVIGELENGTLSTQGTPRIRMLLQNNEK